jgi:predicted nucleic acid-binding protein
MCYLDTSVVTTALLPSINHHSAALEYCRNVAEQRGSVCFSELLRLEYAQFLRIVPSRLDIATQRAQGVHRWDRQSVRERWFRRGWDQFDGFTEQFARTTEFGITRNILDTAIDLMVSCNLGSYDAAHVATALASGATEIATVDGHFSRVSHLIAVRIVRDPQAASS